jgi:hypothetical protein
VFVALALLFLDHGRLGRVSRSMPCSSLIQFLHAATRFSRASMPIMPKHTFRRESSMRNRRKGFGKSTEDRKSVRRSENSGKALAVSCSSQHRLSPNRYPFYSYATLFLETSSSSQSRTCWWCRRRRRSGRQPGISFEFELASGRCRV